MPTQFFANNRITNAAWLSATNQEAAVLSEQVEPHAQGQAQFFHRGTFTGNLDRAYIVQAVTSGTLRWSEDGGVNWSAASAFGFNQWMPLSHGVEVMLSPGPSPDIANVVAGDEWQFQAIRKHGVGSLVSYDRDLEFRSAAVAPGGGVSVAVDLQVPTTVQAVLLYDLNAPSGTSLIINASTTANFAVLNVNQAIPWAPGKVKHLLTAGPHTYRFWRVVIQNVPVALPYVGFSHLYLGDVYTMGLNFSVGYTPGKDLIGESDDAVLIRGEGRFGFAPEIYELQWDRRSSIEQDLLHLRNVRTLTHEEGTGRKKPFFVTFDDVPGLEIFTLAHWKGRYVEPHVMLNRVDVPMELLGLVRTAA